jgi:hypothetical protein
VGFVDQDLGLTVAPESLAELARLPKLILFEFKGLGAVMGFVRWCAISSLLPPGTKSERIAPES